MKKCLNCGTENADYEVFCGECGSRLEDTTAEPSEVKAAEINVQNTEDVQPPHKPESNKNKILLIAVIILSVLVIALLFNQCKAKPEPTSTTATNAPVQVTSTPKQAATTAPTKKPEPTKSPEPVPKEKEFIKENYGYVEYSELARNPDSYKGKSLTYKGKVIQVIEGDTETQHRIAVNGNYDKVIFVGYPKNMVASRVLEDDYVTVYGTSLGLYSYQSTMGGKITIPALYLDRIEIN